MAKYFSHPGFWELPVVGVSWKQATILRMEGLIT